MKLEYSILWFDDSKDYFESLPIDDLKKEIETWGFNPTITFVNNGNEFIQYSPYIDFDLIVIDKKLEQEPDGQIFIQGIRSHSVYTEIIFYTIGEIPVLWEEIAKQRLEGVFVTPRADVLSKIVKVGKQSVKKVLDLENMRGIVMAEVGEVDHILAEILLQGLTMLSEAELAKLFDDFSKSGISLVEKNKKKYELFVINPSVEQLVDIIGENSFQLWMYFGKFRSRFPNPDIMIEIGNYADEVLSIRNILAHGRAEKIDERYLFKHRGKDYSFDDETSLLLRQTILNYKKLFSLILSSLNSL